MQPVRSIIALRNTFARATKIKFARATQIKSARATLISFTLTVDLPYFRIEANYDVEILGGLHEFVVRFTGPKGSPYECGVWKVRVDLPDKYPFKSPSIGFMNRIFHPNIDEM